MLVEERREKLINTISHLPEDKLAIVEELLLKINNVPASLRYLFSIRRHLNNLILQHREKRAYVPAL